MSINMTLVDYDRAMEERGWVIFEKAISDELVMEMKKDVLAWIEICKEYQIRNGINEDGDGTAHQTIGRNDSIDKFYAMHLFHDYISRYFGGKPYILSCSTPTAGYAHKPNYLQRVHRDVGTYIDGYNLRLNLIVMLDDFTEENGATRILSGSHCKEEKPTDEEFEASCQSITGPAGSVVLFNSYLWHRGGVNRTNNTRVALTSGFTRPFVKPQTDYARMLGEEYGKGLSELTRQLLGYNSRVPVSLDEWYRPDPRRLYQKGQG
ncbi:phytanoyl-CoA dioxygenase family protein [Halomonas beimenensis]|uniref:Ectoine hydroxylase-related dioxygenase, phytanoyl-CoA dioxygenase (PhyH) family n=1 Tax=Halomonas beimenensis TaxID=475662 RepID=A0A291P8A8_9GAMM|nr:phytanoyl-CoA dioxygenase family protein [Halomonas beimenensis]ATJ83146.1 ectoine hydroxylase-related dioxygenase, phytanoyl-CoA dioxygenase (PhyH) family [Halomonas beimenensis]